MAAHEVRDTIVDRNQFLQQVVLHHRSGDHYPDPRIISYELQFTPAQTDAVLSALRTLRWIADSPYGAERLRLTPRCWSFLHRVSRIPESVPATYNGDVCPIRWHPVDALSDPVALHHVDMLATLVK
jgi:hypothetical protein